MIFITGREKKMNNTMRVFLFLIILTGAVIVLQQRLSSVSKNKPEKDDFNYSKYKTVQIGNRLWMAENMNEPTEESFCYENDPQNCEKYGRLYTFKAAQNVCPSGWHLANLNDEKELMQVLGENDKQRIVEKLATNEWLSILFAGSKNSGKHLREGASPFHDLGSNAKIWLDSYYGGCCSIYMEIGTSGYTASGGIDTQSALSVRCVKDFKEAASPKSKPHLNKEFVKPSSVKRGSFSDTRDGYVYKTITIGKQTWFAENLQYSMPESECASQDDDQCRKYGRVYDWNDAMTACPNGWRLPSASEANDLTRAVGNSASKVKSVHGWEANGGTDDYGFTLLPIDGRGTYVWTSTQEQKGASADYFAVSFGHDRIIHSAASLKQKHSVRCIMK